MDALGHFRQAVQFLIEEFGLDFRPANFDATRFLKQSQIDELRGRYRDAYIHGIEMYFDEAYRIEPDKWHENIVRPFATGVEPDRWNPLVRLLAGEWRRRAAKVTPKLLLQVIQQDHAETDRLACIRVRQLCRDLETHEPSPPEGATPQPVGAAPSSPRSPASPSVEQADNVFDPTFDSVASDPATSIKRDDPQQELRRATQCALWTFSADGLAKETKGVVHRVAIDGETVRRFASGRTRKLHRETRHQLALTLIKLGFLPAENEENAEKAENEEDAKPQKPAQSE
jgi:hypothetical protein